MIGFPLSTGKRIPTLAASSILQTFGCQSLLLFVKPAVCNSVPQMSGLSLPLHRKKTQMPSSFCLCSHLSTSMQSGLRLGFRGSLSCYSDHSQWLLHLSRQGNRQHPPLIHLTELICARESMLIWTSGRSDF